MAHISVVLKIMERRAKLLALDMRPDDQETGDKFVVVPAWAMKPGQQAVDGAFRALEPADQDVILGEAVEAADAGSPGIGPLPPQDAIPGPPGTQT